MTHHEKIKFTLFVMPCCGHNLCWVNPRLPTYCPECGKGVLLRLKFPGKENYVLLQDDDAKLTYKG